MSPVAGSGKVPLDELLREVARVAPKEMGAELDLDTSQSEPHSTPYEAVHFMGCPEPFEDTISSVDLVSDLWSAAGTIAMLDAMEKNHTVSLNNYEERRDYGGGYVCTVIKWGPRTARSQDFKGQTRAEAVARAFVAVFGGVK